MNRLDTSPLLIRKPLHVQKKIRNYLKTKPTHIRTLLQLKPNELSELTQWPIHSELMQFNTTISTIQRFNRTQKKSLCNEKALFKVSCTELNKSLQKSLSTDIWDNSSITHLKRIVQFKETPPTNKVRLTIKKGKVIWWVYLENTGTWYKPKPCKDGTQYCDPIDKREIPDTEIVDLSIEEFLRFKNAGKRTALSPKNQTRNKQTKFGNQYISRNRRHRNEQTNRGQARHKDKKNGYPNMTREFDVGSYETLKKYYLNDQTTKLKEIKQRLVEIQGYGLEKLEKELQEQVRSLQLLEMDHIVQKAAWQYYPKMNININGNKHRYDQALKLLTALQETKGILKKLTSKTDLAKLWTTLKTKYGPSTYKKDDDKTKTNNSRNTLFEEFGIKTILELVQQHKTTVFDRFKETVKTLQLTKKSNIEKLKRRICKLETLINKHKEYMEKTGLSIALNPETHNNGRTHQNNNGQQALHEFERTFKRSPMNAFVEAYSNDISTYLKRPIPHTLYEIGAFRHLYKEEIKLYGHLDEPSQKLDKLFLDVLSKL